MKQKKSVQTLLWFAIAFLVIVLDQVTKIAIVKWLPECASPATCVRYEVTSFFNLILRYNPGSAFSFLSEAGGWQRYFLISLAFIASGIMSYVIVKKSDKKFLCAALALLIGGAIGNAIDRFFYKGVVDFVDFHYQFKYHWFTFNVADVAIVFAIILLAIHEVKQR